MGGLYRAIGAKLAARGENEEGNEVGTTRQHEGRPLQVFVLALALATAIAVLDLVLTGNLVLIGSLVAAPLVAALAAGTLRTAIVFAYAVVLGVALGLSDHIFLHGDHISRVLSILAGGALAVWIARLRENRERDSVRL